uniref:uncharacterized protein LOC120339475 n=1 Tax=Styela clava TaxID=7725 RepID=UPI00193A5455|nr:uncharacterized protein LOC120339475 [Styela clava]
MAGAKALRHKLNEEFLTCQICLNTYDDPVLLDCQHSFCRNCVDQCVTMISGGIHCPVCRQRTLLPRKSGLSNLKKNFFVQSLIDTIKGRRESNASTISLIWEEIGSGESKIIRRRHPLCDICDDEVKAMMRCLDCSDYLCGDCHLVHCQTKFTRNHKIVTLGSLKTGKYSSEIQARAKIFCSRHEDEICRMFCQCCKIPVCHDCIQETCGQHPLIQVKAAVEDVKRRSSELVISIGKEISDSKALVDSILETKTKRKNEKEIILRDIEKHTKSIIASVKKRGKALNEALKQLLNDHNKYLGKYEQLETKKLNEIEKTFNGFQIKHQTTLSSGSPTDILNLLSTVEEMEGIVQSNSRECVDDIELKEILRCQDPLVKLTTPSNNEENRKMKISHCMGKLMCKDVLQKDSPNTTSYLEKGLISFGETEDSTNNNIPEENEDPQYCEINDLEAENGDTNATNATQDNTDPNQDALYAKIPRRNKRAKAIRRPQTLSDDVTNSPSMNLRRKLYHTDEEPILMNDTVMCSTSSFDASESTIFSAEDSHDGWSLNSLVENNGSHALQNITPRRDDSSVRRSQSLALLSDQINGIRRPTPKPRKVLMASSVEMLNATDSGDIMSRPNSLLDDVMIRQPIRIRSTENLCNRRSRPDVDVGTVIVSTFEIHGQPCTFTSAPKVALLTNGNIVASDYKAQRIFRFTAGGNFINSFKLIAGGRGLNPIGISTTKKGKIVVTCGETVRVFGVTGKSSKKFGMTFFGKSCGVAVDKKTNKIVITDIEKSCASIHASDGGLEKLFRGGTGIQMRHTEAGEELETLRLHTPYFVAVDQRNGNILVSDWANHDIKIFDKKGNCLACITSCIVPQMSQISSRQKFLNPAGVCVDADGNVFVADHGHNRIAMFNDNWEFQRFVATEQNGLRSPWSIVADGNGRVIVTEYWTKIIKSFRYR